MFITILSLSCLLTFYGTIYGQMYDDSFRLRNDLLTNYSNYQIPVANTSSRLDVNVQIIVYNIPELDPVTGSIQIVMSFVLTWTDAKIQWNPADYGGTSSIHFKDTQVWCPPMGLGTPLQMQYLTTSNRMVHYDASGMAVWKPGLVVESSCTYNMRYWPFDKQTCLVSFFVMDYTSDQVQLFQLGNGINTDAFRQGAEWIMEDISVEFGKILDVSLARYYFKLKRESTFYVMTLVMPLFWLGFLSSFVFLLPSESGERVGFAITILLSISVFLTMITGEMPKSASPISLMCVFVMSQLAVSVATTLFAIYSLILYHRESDIPVGKWFKSIVKLANKKCWTTSKDRVIPIKRQKIDFSTKNADEDGKVTYADDIDDSDVSWTDVSKAFDKLMFIISTLLCLIPGVIFLIYLSAASDYAS